MVKNESIALGTVIFSLFGFNVFMKLLGALKNGWSISTFLSKIFHSGDYLDVPKRTFKDMIIFISFAIYTIFYILQNTTKTSDCFYVKSSDVYVDLPYKWDGLQNYKVYDGYGKEYNCKRIGKDNFDLYFKDKLIGKYTDEAVCNLHGDTVLTSKFPHHVDIGARKYDLEKLLVYGSLEKNKRISWDIINKQNQLNRTKHEIDSLRTAEYDPTILQSDSIDNIERKNLQSKISLIDSVDRKKDTKKDIKESINENVDQAKKFISSKYPNISDEIYNNQFSDYNYIKRELEKYHNMGYFGKFIKYVYSHEISSADLIRIYLNNILPNKDVLNRLCDEKGNLKTITDFDTCGQLKEALNRIIRWKKLNPFIKSLPPRQKILIWENGDFKKDLSTETKNKIYESALIIMENENLKELFFKKVSSIDTLEKFLYVLGNLSKNEPWDYEYWLFKLNETRNTIITYKSKEEKIIIVAVFDFSVMKDVSYMTNWCISREKESFEKFHAKGYQFILYNFGMSRYNDRSVMGFTTTSNHEITDCHNLYNYRDKLDNQMYREHGRYIKDKYIQFDMKQVLKKIDMNIFKKIRHSIQYLLKKKYIGSFIDWYNNDDWYSNDYND